MAYDADGNFFNPYSPGSYEYEMEEGTRGQEPGTGGVVTVAQTPDILRVQQAAPPPGFNTFNQVTAIILSVATLAVPGLGEMIGASILEGLGVTGATAAVKAGVGAAALSAGSTAAQGGSVEDVLKNAATAGFASGINVGMGGGVAGAATGSFVGSAIQGGGVDQVLTNALAAGVGAGVQGVIGPAAGVIARDLVATGGVSDQTLLNAATAEINGFNKAGNASAQIVEGQRTATPEESLTQQILAESERVGQNLGTGTQVAAADTGTVTDAGGGVSVTPQLTKEQQDQINSTGVYEDENGDIRNPDGSILVSFSQTGGAGGAGAGQETTEDTNERTRQLIATVGLTPEGTSVANTGSPDAQYSALVGSTSGPNIDLPLNYFTGKVFDSQADKNNFELQWINLINSSPESSKPVLNAQLNDIRNASVNPTAASTTAPTTGAATGGAAAGGGLAGGGGGPSGGQTQTPSGGAAGADTQFENEILNLISGGAGSGLGNNGGPGAGPLIGGGPGGSTTPTTDAGVGGGTSLVLTNVGPGAGPGAGPATAPGAASGPGVDPADPFSGYVRPTAPDTSGGGGTLPGVAPTPMGVPDLGGPPGITGPARNTGPGGPLEDYNSYGGGPVGDTDPFAGYVRPEAPAYTLPTLPDLPAPTPLPPPVMTPPTANVAANVTVDDTYVRPTAPPYTLPTLPDWTAPTPLPPPVMTAPELPKGNVTVTGGGSNNIANVAYPTITRVPPPPPPRRAPIITGASPARLLADALAAYRPAGAIEGEESGKERQNVWNEKSLRLKDALGL